MKSMSRIDQESRKTYGWFVRVYFKKKMYRKFFNDKFFGVEGGYQRGINWRNMTEIEIGKPRTERPVITNYSRNKTGYIGIHRCIKDGSPCYEICVTFNPRERIQTSVSIRKWGEKIALERAIKRQKELRKR